MTTTTTDYRETIGTTVTGGKVHLAMGKEIQQTTCHFGSHIEFITDEIAELGDGGREETMASLIAAGIRPSRLCANCFSSKFRAIYRAQWEAARAK
jgi:ABC-type amino acid transport system permease subunit